MPLRVYRDKRDFRKTPEPRGVGGRRAPRAGRFVIQKHDATRLHYDFRLEMDGVLKSWAVPKGPSLDPLEKRLAVHVEDHPIDYAGFEGVIPAGEYGAGPVIVWDRGTWAPVGDARAGYAAGHLHFRLRGEKLRGRFALIRMSGPRSEGGKNWLLIKERDDEARRGRDAAVVDRLPRSVKSDRVLEDLPSRPPKPVSALGARKATGAPARAAGAVRGRTRPSTPARAARPSPPARPSALPGAVKVRGLRAFTPQLATLGEAAPEGQRWLHEIKLDGYRVLGRKDGDRVTLLTRAGKDWTARFPQIARALAGLAAKRAVVDGEVVVLGADGRSSFQALQAALSEGDDGELRYFMFDLLQLEDSDLSAVPLASRKEALSRLVGGDRDPLHLSTHVVGEGPAFHAVACEHGLEGIVSKVADAGHVGRRTGDWVKVRCGERQELIVGGYTEHTTDAAAVGALLLGVFDARGQLTYAGRVGTGFSDALRRELCMRLSRLGRDGTPFADAADLRGRVHWVDPTLVVEVAFTEWTADGRLRHPRFLGVREDKRARSVRRERLPATPSAPEGRPATRAGRSRAAGKPVSSAARRTGSGTAVPDRERAVSVLGVRLTHPGRVLWAAQGTTKRDLVAYYERVGERLLASCGDRPLMLYRCPSGADGACFYQKHPEGAPPHGLRAVQVEEKDGTHSYLVLEGISGLVSLVQVGALELHGWGARADLLERPDRVVFDLDPAPELTFERVVEAALDLRSRLEAIGLRTFAKTTGGKGLHVEVPLARVHTWDAVKAFAQGMALTLEREHPDRYVSRASKAARKGRIFVDWLRNLRGATSVVAYSPRARPGATVATPLAWEEVDRRLRPDWFTVTTVPGRVDRRKDPWAGRAAIAQCLPSGPRAS